MTRVALALLLVCLLGGCSGSTLLTGSHRPVKRSHRVVTSRHAAGSRRAAPSRVVAALGSPVCTSAASTQPPLGGVRTAFVATEARPFGVVTAVGGAYSFVSTGQARPTHRRGRGMAGAIEVMSDGSFAPQRVGTVALPAPAQGEAFSLDGRYLLAATGSGAAVISAPRAELGARHAVLGILASGGRPGVAAREVTIAPGDGFVFVSLGAADEIAVFDLRAALRHGFRTSGLVGMIPLGREAGGMAISPNGRWLYVTSGGGRGGAGASAGAGAGAGAGGPAGQGTLSVIDLRRAESDPARAVVSTVTAGCGPAQVAVAPLGAVVWVTAGGSDALLGFSANKLSGDPRHALVATVHVGQAPIGLAIIGTGDRIVVADSGPPGEPGTLAVVNATAALAGQPVAAGLIPAGSFPRAEAVEPNGHTLLVTNSGSDQLEAVDLGSLP